MNVERGLVERNIYSWRDKGGWPYLYWARTRVLGIAVQGIGPHEEGKNSGAPSLPVTLSSFVALRRCHCRVKNTKVLSRDYFWCPLAQFPHSFLL